VADLVLSGRVQVRPFVEVHDLEDGPAIFAEPSHGGKRPILVP
jgi:hypothetical protein